MRSFEMDFDFDFEEGVGCRRTKGFRGGDDCHTLSGMHKSRIYSVEIEYSQERIFTSERETRVQAHCKRVQAELKTIRRR